MVEEQEKDETLLKIKNDFRKETLTPSVARKYIVLDNILYYISYSDTDPVLRLYVKHDVLVEYHTTLGHLVMDKTHDAIHSKYYWPNLFKMYLPT